MTVSSDISLGNLPDLLKKQCFLIAIWLSALPRPLHKELPTLPGALQVRGLEVKLYERHCEPIFGVS